MGFQAIYNKWFTTKSLSSKISLVFINNLLYLLIVAYTAQTRCDREDVVFVVDASGSIGRQNWPQIQNFMKNLVRDFVIGPENTQVRHSTNYTLYSILDQILKTSAE